nr:MAG TPA: hypothetical protein [Caudoviricetes sp.]
MFPPQTLTISFLIKAIWKSFGIGITFRRCATSATAERPLVRTAASVTLQESDAGFWQPSGSVQLIQPSTFENEEDLVRICSRSDVESNADVRCGFLFRTNDRLNMD